MNASDLMVDLAQLGIQLEARGDRLRYCPRSAVTPDLADRMKAHKIGLLEMLRTQSPGHASQVHFSSKSENWETPQDLFDELNRKFGFDVDVCATQSNAKCARYFSPEDDGLSQSWEGVCWMNPPYGREIRRWMKKAFESSRDGATVVCLVPSRTDTGWWHDYAMRGEIRSLRGRLKFSDAQNSAPFPSAIVVFRPLSGQSPESDEEYVGAGPHHDDWTELRRPDGGLSWIHSRHVDNDFHAIDPPDPCPTCGTLEIWQTLVGNWRCLRCDPPTSAWRLMDLANRLRSHTATRRTNDSRPT